jgi:hypothetical protein
VVQPAPDTCTVIPSPCADAVEPPPTTPSGTDRLATGCVPELLAAVCVKKRPTRAVPVRPPKPARPPPGQDTLGWPAVQEPPDVTVIVPLATRNASQTIGKAFGTGKAIVLRVDPGMGGLGTTGTKARAGSTSELIVSEPADPFTVATPLPGMGIVGRVPIFSESTPSKGTTAADAELATLEEAKRARTRRVRSSHMASSRPHPALGSLHADRLEGQPWAQTAPSPAPG